MSCVCASVFFTTTLPLIGQTNSYPIQYFFANRMRFMTVYKSQMSQDTYLLCWRCTRPILQTFSLLLCFRKWHLLSKTEVSLKCKKIQLCLNVYNYCPAAVSRWSFNIVWIQILSELLGPKPVPVWSFPLSGLLCGLLGSCQTEGGYNPSPPWRHYAVSQKLNFCRTTNGVVESGCQVQIN